MFVEGHLRSQQWGLEEEAPSPKKESPPPPPPPFPRAEAFRSPVPDSHPQVVSCETMRSDLARKMDSDAIQTMIGRKVDVSQVRG